MSDQNEPRPQSPEPDERHQEILRASLTSGNTEDSPEVHSNFFSRLRQNVSGAVQRISQNWFGAKPEQAEENESPVLPYSKPAEAPVEPLQETPAQQAGDEYEILREKLQIVTSSLTGEEGLETPVNLLKPAESNAEDFDVNPIIDSPVVFIDPNTPFQEALSPSQTGTMDPDLAMFFDQSEFRPEEHQTAHMATPFEGQPRPLPFSDSELAQLNQETGNPEPPLQRVVDFDIKFESSPTPTELPSGQEVYESVVPVEHLEEAMPEWLRNFENPNGQGGKPDIVENRQPFTLEEPTLSPLERLHHLDAPEVGGSFGQEKLESPQAFAEADQFEWAMDEEEIFAAGEMPQAPSTPAAQEEPSPQALDSEPAHEGRVVSVDDWLPEITTETVQSIPPTEEEVPPPPPKTTGSLLSFLEQGGEEKVEDTSPPEMPFTLVDSDESSGEVAFIEDTLAVQPVHELPDDFSDFLQKLQNIDETLVEPVQPVDFWEEAAVAPTESAPIEAEGKNPPSEVEQYAQEAAANWERWGYQFEEGPAEGAETTRVGSEQPEAPQINQEDLYNPPEINPVIEDEDQESWQAPFTEDIDQIMVEAEANGLILPGSPTDEEIPSEMGGGINLESSDDAWRSMFGTMEYSPGSKAGKAVVDDARVQADGSVAGNFNLFLRRMRNWLTSLSRLDKILLGLAFFLIVAAITIGVFQLMKPAAVISEATKEPETVLVARDTNFVPVSLELPGGWIFDLSKGEVIDGRWQPKGAEWLAGTELRRVIALPWSIHLEAYVKTLQNGDTINIYMDNDQTLVYHVDRVEQVKANENKILSGTDLSMIIILSQPDSDSRWVVFCRR